MAYLSNDFYVGSLSTPIYHFQNADVTGNSGEGTFATDVIGNELSIDQFSFSVKQTDPGIASIPYGTPVWWLIAGSFYAKGYLKSIDRISKSVYKLTCTSGVGLLETQMDGGGIFLNYSLPTVLSSIINGAFSWTIDPATAATAAISGHLPYDTRRNNLHRVLFATGLALIKDSASNDYKIEYLNNAVIEVPSSRIAMQGSIQAQLPTNRVDVTEHSFFDNPSQQTETLFDNTNEAAAVNLLVTFDTPVVVSSLAATGTLTISSSGANFAVVSGIGTLIGRKYIHTTNVITLINNPTNAPERVRRVTDNELVTAVNSYNVARRVLSYFQSAKTVKAKIMLADERCGDLIKFADSFGELTQGYLAKMNTLVSSVIGAQCEIVAGYVPGNNGNNYLYRQVITASGNWTVPAGVTRIRIVLIGGGTGGTGGDGGEGGDGGAVAPSYGKQNGLKYYQTGGVAPSGATFVARGYYYQNQLIALGGAAGVGGAGGKVLVIDKDVIPGDVIAVAVGAGGVGGAAGSGGQSNRSSNPTTGGAGQNGTATTATSTSIGTLSSESGLSGYGYYDQMTGDVFGAPGSAGFAGGNGGQTDTASLQGDTGANGKAGGNSGQYAGGTGGVGFVGVISLVPNATASGGGGGGAAFGAQGSSGGTYSNPGFELRYANGGNGASAIAPQKASYGNGGTGGNGGGGGGNGAGGGMPQDFWEYDELIAGNGGEGGNGSAGGDGGDGIAIIYW